MASILLTFLPACKAVDRTSDYLDRAITSIDAAPGNWRAVGSDLIRQLGDEGSTFLDRVQSLYTGALGQTQNFTFCSVDFFGQRFNDNLKMLLHEIDQTKPVPTLVPVVCNTDPVTSVEAGKTRLVTLYGFDLTTYEKQNPFKVQVQYRDGSVPMDLVGSVSATSNYQMGIDIQSVDFTVLRPDLGPKLVILWGATEVERPSGVRTELPILLPAPPSVRYSTVDFRVEKHAASGYTSGYCTELKTTYNVIDSRMVIDVGKGDPGHAGISQLTVDDNKQSRDTLRSYNYQAISPTAVEVTGRVCGASLKGPGAIFSRAYRIYLKSS